MNIELPCNYGARGDISIPETRVIMEAFCEFCDLDPKYMTCVVVGGRHQHKFKHIGVRLESLAVHDRMVPILIGCKKDTIYAHIYYVCGAKALNVGDLYKRLEQCLDNKVYLYESVRHHGVTKKSESHIVPVSFASVNTQYFPIRNISVSYAGFFDEPDRLHTAVLALVMEYGTDHTFSFEEFASVLQRELNIGCSVRAMRPMIRIFTGHHYISVHYNEHQAHVYRLTALAVRFAKMNMARKLKRSQHESTPFIPKQKLVLNSSVPTKVSTLQTISSALVTKQNQLLHLAELKRTNAEQDITVLLRKRDALEVELASLGKQRPCIRQRQHLTELNVTIESFYQVRACMHDLHEEIYRARTP